MNNVENNSTAEISKKTIDVVVARMRATISPNLRLARGMGGSLDRDQMIEHVKNRTDVGQRLIQSHLNFMKAQASGQLVAALNTVK